MSRQKSKWLVFAAAIGCAGCCALPLYLWVGGISAAGFMATLFSKQSVEAVLCIAPLAAIAGYFFYRQHSTHKNCCAAPSSECRNAQCDSHKVD